MLKKIPQLKVITIKVLILLTLLATNACTTLVDSMTEKPIQTNNNQRSFGTYIDDRRLQVIVGVNLRKADSRLKDSNIDVHAFNGVVLLTGQTPSEELKQLATATANQIEQVKLVYNEITVSGNSAFLTRTNDTWLAARISSALLSHEGLKNVKVKTIVENGRVYLMGIVNKQQGILASNVASNINGVLEVIRVFEYIEQ